MPPREPRRRRATSRGLRILVGQVGYQLRLLARSPIAAFATLVIPLMTLLAVSLLYAGTRLQSQGNISYAQFFTPAMVAFATVTACYAGVITSTVLAREQGILKRLRATPLPPWAYLAGRIITAGLVAAVSAAVIVAVGAGVYGFHVIWSSVPAALLTIAVAIFCFCSLGLAISALVPSAEAALPIAWGTLLPLCFISDVFEPIARAPHWLRALASAFPVRPFADNLEALFNPVTGSSALNAGHLELLVAWGGGAALFALIAFRWEPAGGRPRRAPRRDARPEPMATVDRLRELFEARGERLLDPHRPLTARLLAAWRFVIARVRHWTGGRHAVP
jgi:ABC-2 type transport system permease protein